MEKKIKSLYFIIVFLMVSLCSNTILIQSFEATKTEGYLFFVFSVISFFILKNKRVNTNQVLSMLALIMMVLISAFVNFDMNNLNGYILICLRIASAFFLLQVFDKKMFQKAFSNVMTLLSLASLIVTYILPMDFLKKIFPVIINKSGVPFCFAFLSNRIDAGGVFGVRNYGLFSEPAVYCFFLCMGVICCVSQKGIEGNLFKIPILSLTLISTFSPIGLLAGSTFLIIRLTEICISRDYKARTKIIFVIAIVAIYVLLTSSVSLSFGLNTVIEKSNISSGSGLGRTQSITSNIKQALNKPITGGGLKSVLTLTSELGFNTTTSFLSLSAFGFLFFLVTIILQIRSIKCLATENGQIFCIIAIAVWFLCINDYGYIQSFWYWFFTLFCLGRGNKKDEAFNNDLQPRNIGQKHVKFIFF